MDVSIAPPTQHWMFRVLPEFDNIDNTFMNINSSIGWEASVLSPVFDVMAIHLL